MRAKGDQRSWDDEDDEVMREKEEERARKKEQGQIKTTVDD